MPKGGIWIALLLLALVGGGIGYLVYQDEQKPAETPADNSTRVFPDGLKELSTLRLERPTGLTIVLQAKGPDVWEIIEPARHLADLAMAGELVGNLQSMNAERVIDMGAEDPRNFGLHAPMMSITAHEGEKTRTLEIGGMNPTGDFRYARLVGDSRLFLVGMATVGALNKSLGELRDGRVFPTNDFGVQKLSVEGPAGKRSLLRRDNRDWTFQEPVDFFANQSMISEFVNSVVRLRADAEVLNAEPLPDAKFRALPLYASVKVTTESTELSAELRGVAGKVYAKSNNLDGAYPVPADFESYLRKPISEYRDLRVFRFGFQDVFRITYEGQGKTFTIEKPNEGWRKDGKNVDPALANTLLDELRGLNATAYLEGSAPGERSHAIRVQTSDGREEAVQFLKSGDDLFAVRAEEKGYYKIPASFLKGIDSAAGGIAP